MKNIIMVFALVFGLAGSSWASGSSNDLEKEYYRAGLIMAKCSGFYLGTGEFWNGLDNSTRSEKYTALGNEYLSKSVGLMALGIPGDDIPAISFVVQVLGSEYKDFAISALELNSKDTFSIWRDYSDQCDLQVLTGTR